MPRTQLETEMVGDTVTGVNTKVKELMSETANNVTATAERTFEAVKAEAAAHGLTPEDAKEGAAAIGKKLKSVAKWCVRGNLEHCVTDTLSVRATAWRIRERSSLALANSGLPHHVPDAGQRAGDRQGWGPGYFALQL